MNKNSLKLRLLLSAALGIAISLLIAGVAFVLIFQHYAEQLAERELANDLVRELFVKRYRLIYEVSQDRVVILVFIHGARRFPATLG